MISLGDAIAEVIDELIGAGYPPSEVWSYTPRRLLAVRELADKRRKRRAAELLQIVNLGSRGELQQLKKVLAEWRV